VGDTYSFSKVKAPTPSPAGNQSNFDPRNLEDTEANTLLQEHDTHYCGLKVNVQQKPSDGCQTKASSMGDSKTNSSSNVAYSDQFHLPSGGYNSSTSLKPSLKRVIIFKKNI